MLAGVAMPLGAGVPYNSLLDVLENKFLFSSTVLENKAYRKKCIALHDFGFNNFATLLLLKLIYFK